MVKLPYGKPYLNLDQQIALLERRGMEISDRVRARAYLQRIGYYRLSGYWYPFRRALRADDEADGRLIVLDEFRAGARFSHVIDLYVFDKRLRLLVLDAIERIEIGLRVDVALTLGARDPWAHLNPRQLHGAFAKRLNRHTDRTGHQDWLQRQTELIRRSNKDFVRHFVSTYDSPLWMAVELWDFGMLSRFLAGMRVGDLTEIAGRYGLPRWELLTSWMRAINHVRNICAHHSRLWNRPPSDQPKLPKPGEIALLDHLVDDRLAQTRLYAVAAAMQFLLRTINPSTSWADRLKDQVGRLPEVPGLGIRQAGFPQGWHAMALWDRAGA